MIANGKNGRPKVSIVVPMFNDEEYAAKCFDSILSQTVSDWEAWIVDDCSEDNSVDIAEEYCKKDARFHLIRNSVNSSAWTCRAKGIEAASGDAEYIMFADTDDYYEPNAVGRALELMLAHPVDILNFGVNVIANNVDESKFSSYSEMLQPRCVLLRGFDVFRNFVDCKFEGHLWNRMFNAKYLKDIISHYGVERYLPKAQDKALYTAICCFKPDVTYRGVPDRLYNYNYGLGLEGAADTLSLEEFRKYAAMADSEALVDQALRESSFPESKYRDMLIMSRRNLIHHNVKNLVRLDEKDFLNGLELLRQKWNGENDTEYIIGNLAKFTWDSQIRYSELLLGADMLRTSKAGSDIKTIGTYYHRMDNGGIQQVISKICDHWHALGYEVVMFCDSEPTPDDYELPDYVTRVNTGVLFSKCTGGNYIDRCVSMAALIRKYNVDCMVYHAYFADTLLYDMLLCKALNVPFVLYEHNVFSRFARYSDERFSSITYFAKHANAVACLDQVSCSWWKMFNPNSYVVTNPLTFSLNEISPSERSNNNILFLCRLDEAAKHPLDAMSIIRKVADTIPDAKLYVVGSGSDSMMKELNMRIEELELGCNVLMCGFHKEVSSYYRECSVFLSCSSHEGAPMTLCEAMSYSLPIVMYDLPYLEAVRGNSGVVTVPQRDVEAAADEICRLLSDREALIRTGDEGRRFLEKMYQTDIGGQWESIVKGIAPEAGYVPLPCSIGSVLAADYYDGITAWMNDVSNSRLRDTERKLRNCSNQLNDIRNSVSFRVGRVITYIPRKLRDLLKRFI